VPADLHERATVAECTPVARAALYEKRIRPLLAEERPKSCNRCHLAGVDVGMFVRATPCRSMRCMAHLGLVSLEDPPASKILAWIGRAAPASPLVTEAVVAEERSGLRAWIEQAAICGPCTDEELGALDPDADPCAADGRTPQCPVGEAAPLGDPEIGEVTDPGGCAPELLESLFVDRVYRYRYRCYPCHFEGHGSLTATIDALPSPPPAWIRAGDCASGAVTTMRAVLDGGYVDRETPAASLLLRKPLAEQDGGLPHGGGPKFGGVDDPSYQDFRAWIERYAACAGG
jgi:hypothetical protein